MYKLADPTWWRSVAGGLVRTMIAALAPFLPVIASAPASPATWRTVLLVVGLAVVGSIATSLSKLPNPSGLWWEVALQRSARQAGQMILPAIAGAVSLSDLNWQTILVNVGWSALATFVLAALSLGVDPIDLKIGEAVTAIDDPQATSDTAGTDTLDDDLAGTPAGDVGADGDVPGD